jgi:hypothetical protein
MPLLHVRADGALDDLVGDFRRWKDHDAYSKAFERLLRDLRVEPAD